MLLHNSKSLSLTSPHGFGVAALASGVFNGRRRLAFTLIELMIVIGIIAIVLTMAIPNVYRYFHPSSIQKALDDTLDACREAREVAVLRGTTTALVIDLKNKSLSIRGATAPPPDTAPASEFPELNARPKASEVPVSGKTYQYSDKILIEGLGINGLDYTEDEQAEVRFYPKGTSDEFSIVLLSDHNERRNIFLDAVTGHPDFEVDPQKFRHR